MVETRIFTSDNAALIIIVNDRNSNSNNFIAPNFHYDEN